MEKEELEQEIARLRDLVDLIKRYHHHLAVWKLVVDGHPAEIAAWQINGERLQRDAEQCVPQLK